VTAIAIKAGDKLKLAIEGIEIIQEISNSQLAIADVKVCHTGMNAHEKPFDLDTLKLAEPTLINKFLVAGFNGKDFAGHEVDQLIIGFFPESTNIRYIEENNKHYLVATAIISKVYAYWAYDLFTQGNYKECSMEITVVSAEVKDDGYEWLTAFIFNGVTVLGESHQAACPGSNIQIIQFSTDEMQQYEQLYRCEFSKYKDKLDFTIPEQVRINAKTGLETGGGKSPISRAIAKYLSANTVATPEKVQHIADYYGKARTDKDKLMFGGSDGYEWAMELTQRMKDIQQELNTDEKEANKEKMAINKTEVLAKFGLTANEFREALDMSIRDIKYKSSDDEWSRFWINDYDDAYMYCYDYDDGGTKAIPYSTDEAGNVTADESGIKKARMTYVIVGDETESDTDDETAYCNSLMELAKAIMGGGKGFTSDANTEAVAQEAMNDKEAENNKELIDDNKDKTTDEDTSDSKFEVVRGEMQGTIDVLTTKVAELEKYKFGIEEAQKLAEIEFTLSEVSEFMPEDEINKHKDESKNYTLANLDAWRNGVKANAFNFSKDKKDKKGITRMALPINEPAKNKTTGTIWDKI
jgi:hypothetical protein